MGTAKNSSLTDKQISVTIGSLTSRNKKFFNRFKAVEGELVNRGLDINKASLGEMDEIWNEIKTKAD